MEKELTGEQRRKKILELLQHTKTPLSGTQIGKETEVSRQVVVQDIALLRESGVNIIATARGYTLEHNTDRTRLLKVHHTNEQIEEELNAIVDLGGCVIDVIINHRTYGKMTGILNIKSRRDVHNFLEDIKSGKSSPLLNITSGYHFHHISAENQEILDEIENSLKEKGFLADILPYEKELTASD